MSQRSNNISHREDSSKSRYSKQSKKSGSEKRWIDEDICGETIDIGDSDSLSGDISLDGRRESSEGLISNRENPTSGPALFWSREEIEKSLRELLCGEEFFGLIRLHNEAVILSHKHALSSALLISSWIGEVNILLQLLKQEGVNINICDHQGRTALHLACCASHAPCISALISQGASSSVWDLEGLATPLHCAAAVGDVICLNILLRSSQCDINAGLVGRRNEGGGRATPLHCAVNSGNPACVDALLKAGACPNTLQVFTETPLHVAAALGSAECVRLLLAAGADVRSQMGVARTTALHLASEDGNSECAQLLVEAGADLDARNSRKQTPLHLAALAQAAGTLELLLSRGADVNSADADGRAPLHAAIVKVSRSCECVRLLVDYGAQINLADRFGYTPLHLAALNELSSCVQLLVRRGGDVTRRTHGGVSALALIARRTPDALPKFIAALDSAVRLHEHEIGDIDCEIKLELGVLVPGHNNRCLKEAAQVNQGESALLLTFIEVGHRELLKHPLCETFLFLKWRKIRKFFLLGLVFHLVYVLAYSGLVIYHVGSTLLLVLNLVLLMKEIFQMAHSWRGYVRHWDNWLQWFILITAFIVGTSTLDPPHSWQDHIAAVGIFLSWLELMLLIGRFPMFGLYIQMFTTVAWNFAKFLLAYSCLLIAFTLSFTILFHNYKALAEVGPGFMKILVMMSGELEFEDIFYENSVQFPITAHLLFTAFVLLITVVLTNLLVGLAVNDIQGLQRSAGLDRLERQAELVAHLENMLFSRLLHWVPRPILMFLRKSALLLAAPYPCALYIRPNDPRDNRLPRELARGAYRLVAERRRREPSRSCRARDFANLSYRYHMSTPQSSSRDPIIAVKEALRILENTKLAIHEGNQNRLTLDLILGQLTEFSQDLQIV